MRGTFTVAVDFDGTIVQHEYPRIGPEAPGAFKWLKKFQELGMNLILYTMRADAELTEAIEFCRENGIEFYGINENPDQASWTTSPKVYAQRYIDDNAVGCPLIENPKGRPYVDWEKVGPMIIEEFER